jgi:hypothetical protein
MSPKCNKRNMISLRVSIVIKYNFKRNSALDQRTKSYVQSC